MCQSGTIRPNQISANLTQNQVNIFPQQTQVVIVQLHPQVNTHFQSNIPFHLKSIHRGSQLIRVHQQVRNQAFDPTMVDDCPVDLLMISGERTTSGRSVDDQVMWSQTDQWGTVDSQWEKPQTWTGITG